MAWVKVKEGGEWQSPIAKFFNPEQQKALADRLKLKVGDTAVFVADEKRVVNAALGKLRKHIAKHKNLVPEGEYRFVWVTDFPLFEWDKDSGRYFSAHHPFTAPHPSHRDKLRSEPGEVKALAYDIVLNGIE